MAPLGDLPVYFAGRDLPVYFAVRDARQWIILALTHSLPQLFASQIIPVGFHGNKESIVAQDKPRSVLTSGSVQQGNSRRRPNVVLMLAHRLRRWAIIKTTLGRRLLFVLQLICVSL